MQKFLLFSLHIMICFPITRFHFMPKLLRTKNLCYNIDKICAFMHVVGLLDM